MSIAKPLTRDAWVEVDLGAIRHNVAAIRNRIGYKPKICAVVKADAYGHGAVRVAKAAIDGGACWLAVATLDEAIELRDAGIGATILLLSEPPIRSLEKMLTYRDLIPSVSTIDFALEMGRLCDAQGRVAPFHLAVNTGMNRIGVLYNEVVQFLDALNPYTSLKLTGVFTHFATADAADDWDLRVQCKRFNQCLEDMRSAGIDPGIVHCCNSAAAIRYPQLAFDMVRWGISLYGLHSSTITYGMINLQPAMSVYARVNHVTVPAVGEGVSYGMIYRSAGGVQIATIPIGYADGLRRGLSEKINVIYKGRLLSQVGRICMDQCMFEVPTQSRLSRHDPMPPIKVGDQVTIVGEQDGAKITVDMLANKLGTINHEITCGFGMRLPRIYV